jgi:C4-dicarboxylate-specific signal transduction histidine kinase
MAPKDARSRKKSLRKDVKQSSSSCDVRSLSDARLEKILGKLCKNAEDAMSAPGLPEKSKKAMEKVCALAKEARQQQPVALQAGPKRKTSVKRPSHHRPPAAR